MSVATIVSQSTPSGFSAIAVIRISGTKATKIAGRLSNQKAVLKHHKAELRPLYIKKKLIDKVIFTAFLSPHSYTGEDVVEISCHGIIHICEAILTEAIKLGARIAEPGEYTIQLTVTDVYGSSSSEEKTVAVSTEPNTAPDAVLDVYQEN